MKKLVHEPLDISAFRCPHTGSSLTAEPDGSWRSPEGDNYPLINGLRFFTSSHETASSVESLYGNLLDNNGFRYGAVAYVSETVFHRTLKATRKMFAEDSVGLRILDVGCGFGAMSTNYVDRNQVVGVDLTPSLLRHATEAGLETYVADALALPFQPDLFDRVLCVHLIQIVPDPVALLRSLERVVRPGGEVLIATINGECLQRRLYRAAMALGFFRPKNIPVDTFPNRFGMPQLRQWIGGTSLEIVDIGVTFAPTGLFQTGLSMEVLPRLLADSIFIRLRKGIN